MTASPGAPSYEAPKAPTYLRKAGKQLWCAVCVDWALTLDDPNDLEVLALAATAADRAAEAREVIRRDGLTILDRFGTVKPHPAVDIEAKSAARAAALVEQVNRGRIAFERLQLATERQERASERAAKAEQSTRNRSRRGGGQRHWPRAA